MLGQPPVFLLFYYMSSVLFYVENGALSGAVFRGRSRPAEHDRRGAGGKMLFSVKGRTFGCCLSGIPSPEGGEDLKRLII